MAGKECILTILMECREQIISQELEQIVHSKKEEREVLLVKDNNTNSKFERKEK